MKYWVIILGICVAAPVVAVELTTPTGRIVTLFDVVLEPDVDLARFRFLLPDISPDAAGLAYADVLDDMQYLCDEVALPGLAASAWEGNEVIVSFSSAEVGFGEIAPEVTQFFQPFRVDGETCIWEDF